MVNYTSGGRKAGRNEINKQKNDMAMNNNTNAAVTAIREALEYWSIRANNDYQAGIIYGLRLALEKIENKH